MVDNSVALQVQQIDLGTPLYKAAMIHQANISSQQEEFKMRQAEMGSAARGLTPYVNSPEFPQKWAEMADQLHQSGAIPDDLHQKWRNNPSPLLLKSIIQQTNAYGTATDETQDAGAASAISGIMGGQQSSNTSIPASIRTNNPGAQWPGQTASQFGSTGSQSIGGNNQIATFADPVQGGAAQFGLLAKNYVGMPLNQAIQKWSGGNSSSQYTQAVSRATGLDPNTPLTPELLSDPKVAIPLAKAMAKQEAGRDYPMTDDQWQQAHSMAMGEQQVASANPQTMNDATTQQPQNSGNTQVADNDMQGKITKLLQSPLKSVRDYGLTLQKKLDENNIDVAGKIQVQKASSHLLRNSTIDNMADQYLAGDTTVLQNLGRGTQGAANIVALRDRISEKMTEQGIDGQTQALKMAEFKGLTAGEKTLGTRAANIGMAANTANQFAPIAISLSDKINRTANPTLNSVLLAGEKGVGDENVVRLGVATNSLINAYARAINPNGIPTDSDKNHARDILSIAFSKGQFSAAVKQMQVEINAELKAPSLTQKDLQGLQTGRGAEASGQSKESLKQKYGLE